MANVKLNEVIISKLKNAFKVSDNDIQDTVNVLNGKRKEVLK